MYKQLLMRTACFLCIQTALSSPVFAEITEEEAKKIVTTLHEKILKSSGNKHGNKKVDFQNLGFYYISTHAILRNILESIENLIGKTPSKGVKMLETTHQELAALRVLMHHANQNHQKHIELTLAELEFLAKCVQNYPKGIKLIKELMGDYYQMKEEILWPDLVTMLYPDNSVLEGAFANQDFYHYAQEQISRADNQIKQEAVTVLKQIEKRYGLKSKERLNKERLHKENLKAQHMNINETARNLLEEKAKDDQILAADLSSQTDKIHERLAARRKKNPRKASDEITDLPGRAPENIPHQSALFAAAKEVELDNESIKTPDRFEEKKEEVKHEIKRKKALGLLKDVNTPPLQESGIQDEIRKLMEQSHQDPLQTEKNINEEINKQTKATQANIEDRLAARKARQKEKREEDALQQEQSQLKELSSHQKSLMKTRRNELARLHSLNLKIKRLKTDQKKSKKELATLQKEMEKERGEILREKKETERKIYELDRQTGGFDLTLSSLNEEINRLSQNLAQLNSERGEQTNNFKTIKDERDIIEKEIQETKSQAIELQKEMADHDQYMKMRYKEKTYENDEEDPHAIMDDKTKEENYTKALESINKKLETLEGSLKTTDQILRITEESNATKSTDLGAMLESISKLENQKSILEKEKESLEKEKRGLTSPNSKREEKLNSLSKNLHEIEEKIKNLKASKKAVEITKNEAEKNSGSLKKEIVSTTTKQENAKKRIASKEKELQLMKKKNKESISLQQKVRKFDQDAEESLHKLKKHLQSIPWDDTVPSHSHGQSEETTEPSINDNKSERSLADELGELDEFRNGEDGQGSLNYWSRSEED